MDGSSAGTYPTVIFSFYDVRISVTDTLRIGI
jgi:hypothetical protein